MKKGSGEVIVLINEGTKEIYRRKIEKRIEKRKEQKKEQKERLFIHYVERKKAVWFNINDK